MIDKLKSYKLEEVLLEVIKGNRDYYVYHQEGEYCEDSCTHCIKSGFFEVRDMYSELDFQLSYALSDVFNALEERLGVIVYHKDDIIAVYGEIPSADWD